MHDVGKFYFSMFPILWVNHATPPSTTMIWPFSPCSPAALQMWHGDAHMNSAELLRGFFSFYATDFVWCSAA